MFLSTLLCVSVWHICGRNSRNFRKKRVLEVGGCSSNDFVNSRDPDTVNDKSGSDLVRQIKPPNFLDLDLSGLLMTMMRINVVEEVMDPLKQEETKVSLRPGVNKEMN